MGKTFVALAVATSVALADHEGRPVVVMVPPSLREKWPGDFRLFCERCLTPEAAARLWPADDHRPATLERAEDFLKHLDDPPDRRRRILFITHGAMSRGLSDGWVKLAIIQRTLRGRHGVEGLRRALGKFMGRLLRLEWAGRGNPGLWERLLDTPPDKWLKILHRLGVDPEGDEDRVTDDDPVPAAIVRLLDDIETTATDNLLQALDSTPRYQSKHLDRYLREARWWLTDELKTLWRECLKRLRVRLPLLVLDEAHHLKNEKTQLASLFRAQEARDDAEELADRGALGGVFERMLFLTATPFQLGHGELCAVLERFSGIAWDGPRAPACGRDHFSRTLAELRRRLDRAQESALRLDHAWGLLRPEDLAVDGQHNLDVESWWCAVSQNGQGTAGAQQVHARYQEAFQAMRQAEEALQPWIIRHLKPRHLPKPNEEKPRRLRLAGRAILDEGESPEAPGIAVAGRALLPFLLAARATACAPDSRPVFAEGLASSYEAFLDTRRQRQADASADAPTDVDDDASDAVNTGKAGEWYLDRLEALLPCGKAEPSAAHPKVSATVQRALETWRHGEKVVVFCHYIATGRALRLCLSRAIQNEIARLGADKMGCDTSEATSELERLGKRFFDEDSPARRACDEQVHGILKQYRALAPHAEELADVIRRYVRTPSFLVRHFDLAGGRLDENAVVHAFDRCDASQLCLRRALEDFFEFLASRCDQDGRQRYIAAVGLVQTGTHVGREAVRSFLPDELDQARDGRGRLLLPNVRLVNGATRSETRQRLMLTFNTPFYPEVLIASSVMAEGVDLHLNCRYVIHHDLCWNPSTLEQRTGRIDRIGAKAERCGQPIHVYLPYVAETQDEKMYRVVMDRDRWFSVVMGEKFKVDARTTERLAGRVAFPASAASELAFRLEVMPRAEGVTASAPA
jgi:hypothetical protein